MYDRVVTINNTHWPAIGDRERLWLTCGCSIQTTAVPSRD